VGESDEEANEEVIGVATSRGTAAIDVEIETEDIDEVANLEGLEGEILETEVIIIVVKVDQITPIP